MNDRQNGRAETEYHRVDGRGFIDRLHFRLMRNLVLVAGGFVAFLAWGTVVMAEPVRDFLNGPLRVEPETFLEAKAPGDFTSSYVAVSAPELFDTNIGWVLDELVTGRELGECSHIWAVPVGQRLLIVDWPPGRPPEELVGVPATIPPELLQKLYSELDPGTGDLVLPIMLNGAGVHLPMRLMEDTCSLIPHTIAYSGLLVVGILLAFIVVAIVGTALIWPRSPVGRALAKLGDSVANSDSIDADMGSGDSVSIGRLTLGRHWLIERNAFSVRFVRLADVLWLHRGEAPQNSFGLGSTGGFIVLRTRSGGFHRFPVAATRPDELPELLRERCPNAFWGGEPTLESLWKYDFQNFLIAQAKRLRQQRKSLEEGERSPPSV